MEDNQALAPDTPVTDVSVPVTAPAAAETPPPAPAAAVPAEPKPADPTTQTRRDIIKAAMDKPANNRGRHAAYQPRADGKFAPGAPVVPVAAPAAAEPARPALIKSLKKDLEAHWNAAPRELVEAFAQREQDFEKGAAQWKTKAEQADALLNEFRPYEWILRNEGATPQTAIAPLLQTAAILRTGTPAQKAQSVAQMMQQFGIPLEHLQSMLAPNGQQPAALDPQYSHLAQQVQHLTHTQQMQDQQQTQRAITVIQQFAAEPTHPHYAALEGKMLALLQTPHLMGQDVQYMSERDKLQLAYDTALRLDPTLSAQATAQQQSAQQQADRDKAQAAANAARGAAVQVKGAPSASPAAAVNPNDRRAVIANALRAAQA